MIYFLIYVLGVIISMAVIKGTNIKPLGERTSFGEALYFSLFSWLFLLLWALLSIVAEVYFAWPSSWSEWYENLDNWFKGED